MRNLGRKAPSGQWHWMGQATLAGEAGQLAGQKQWMSPELGWNQGAWLPVPCLACDSDPT